MRCPLCMRFYITAGWMFKADPPLKDAYLKKFRENQKGLRIFIRHSHAKRFPELTQWIKKMVENKDCYCSWNLPFTEPEQDITNNARGIQLIIADCLAYDYTFRQEHFHCHIARYNPSMPHSDSARYRPSSHVPPARSNPLRFVKSAR